MTEFPKQSVFSQGSKMITDNFAWLVRNLVHTFPFYFLHGLLLKILWLYIHCNNFCEHSLLCALPSSLIPYASRLHFSWRRKVEEVTAWVSSVLQPLVSYFYVSSRRVTPCSLLATRISAQVSELHHPHGIRKTLEYDSKGQEGCLTSVWRAAKWKKPIVAYS